MGYYILAQASNGDWYFNLKANNHEIILTSQRYSSKQNAKIGISSVQVNSPNEHQYDRLKSTANQPYFNLKATNGEIIGTSEMYSSVSARETGISSVKTNGPTETIIER